MNYDYLPLCFFSPHQCLHAILPSALSKVLRNADAFYLTCTEQIGLQMKTWKQVYGRSICFILEAVVGLHRSMPEVNPVMLRLHSTRNHCLSCLKIQGNA